MKITLLLFLLQLLIMHGCAHYSDVIAGRDGVHEVTASPDEDDEDPDEDELSRDAVTQATDYCEEVFKLKPQILSAKKMPLQDAERSVYQIVVKFKCR
jgi:hypothetical protein